MKKILPLLLFAALAAGVRAQGDAALAMQQRKVAWLLNAVSRLYVDTVDLPRLTETMMEAMLDALDPHSAYLPAEELRRANEPLQGGFSGIGVQFQMLEDTLFVIQTISGCPAEKVGVLPGDRIITVEDSLIAGVGMRTSDIMERLRGKQGTVVRIGVRREGVDGLIGFSIVRGNIPIHSLDAAYMVAPGIAYIKINNFGATTLDEFREALAGLKRKKADKLILDLQGNGGGYLTAAIGMADEFLPAGRQVVATQGVHQPRSVAQATVRGGFETGRLAVLVDEYSASASEIVGGAVQDWDRGVVIGRRTFGKGLVQRQMMLPDGSAVRLTTARYYTPAGRCIQKPYKGIDYQKDLEERFKRGEWQHPDSIHFPDSLKYNTLLNGRTVYGGGGIMPDVFIPADTSRFTAYHRNLLAKGVINRFCVHYVDRHRAAVKERYGSLGRFKERFGVDSLMFARLVEMGEKEKIPFDSIQFEASRPLLGLQLKALVARDIWNGQAYFEIMNESNEALQMAVAILSDPQRYEAILRGERKQGYK